MSLLLVLTGSAGAFRFELAPRWRIRVGRSRGLELTLSHPSVSPVHAEIALDGDRLVVRDLGSEGGTFVNDVRRDAAVLAPGDVLRFGLCAHRVGLESVLADSVRAVGPVRRERRAVVGFGETLALVDLVQVLASAEKTGSLMLQGPRFGRIDFEAGRICYAATDEATGEEALFEILAWSEATFEFVTGAGGRGRNIATRTDLLLVEAVRRLEGERERSDERPLADRPFS